MAAKVLDPKAGPYRATQLWNEAVLLFRNGMPVKKHRKHLKIYEDCFSGLEAVEWFHKELQQNSDFGPEVTREQTQQLLQKFQNALVFENVKDKFAEETEEIFKDSKNSLYKFTDRSPLRTLTNIPYLVKKLNKPNVENLEASPRSKKASDEFPHLNKTDYLERIKIHAMEKQQKTLELADVWKSVVMGKLEAMLGAMQLKSLLPVVDISGQTIVHNADIEICGTLEQQLHKSQHLPMWIQKAMKFVVNWPLRNVDAEFLNTYPGFEKDVFKAVVQYYEELNYTLIPQNMYNIFVHSFFFENLDKTLQVDEAQSYGVLLSCKSVEDLVLEMSSPKKISEGSSSSWTTPSSGSGERIFHLSLDVSPSSELDQNMCEATVDSTLKQDTYQYVSANHILTTVLPPNTCFETAFTSESPTTRIIPQQNTEMIQFQHHSRRASSNIPKAPSPSQEYVDMRQRYAHNSQALMPSDADDTLLYEAIENQRPRSNPFLYDTHRRAPRSATNLLPSTPSAKVSKIPVALDIPKSASKYRVTSLTPPMTQADKNPFYFQSYQATNFSTTPELPSLPPSTQANKNPFYAQAYQTANFSTTPDELPSLPPRTQDIKNPFLSKSYKAAIASAATNLPSLPPQTQINKDLRGSQTCNVATDSEAALVTEISKCHLRSNSGGYVNLGLCDSIKDTADTVEDVDAQELDIPKAIETINSLTKCIKELKCEETLQVIKHSTPMSSTVTSPPYDLSISSIHTNRENRSDSHVVEYSAQTTADGKERVARILQLLLLLLPAANRKKLSLLLAFMESVIKNETLQLHPVLSQESVTINAFKNFILSPGPNDIHEDSKLVNSVVRFLLEQRETLFIVPEDLIFEVQHHMYEFEEQQKANQRTKRMMLREVKSFIEPALTVGLSGKERDNVSSFPKPQPFTYCQQVTSANYEADKTAFSQIALLELLELIIKDPKMDQKEKEERLKSFKKSYPHIYYKRFPTVADEQAVFKRKSKGLLSRFKSLRM